MLNIFHIIIDVLLIGCINKCIGAEVGNPISVYLFKIILSLMQTHSEAKFNIFLFASFFVHTSVLIFLLHPLSVKIACVSMSVCVHYLSSFYQTAAGSECTCCMPAHIKVDTFLLQFPQVQHHRNKFRWSFWCNRIIIIAFIVIIIIITPLIHFLLPPLAKHNRITLLLAIVDLTHYPVGACVWVFCVQCASRITFSLSAKHEAIELPLTLVQANINKLNEWMFAQKMKQIQLFQK